MSGKKLCVSSLVLSIVGLVFSFFLPVVSYACAIPGLIIGIKKRRKNYSSSAGISISIVALSIALINSVLGVVMTVKMFFSDKSDE
ncbi:MAG: hypothetical protein HDT24_05040 [Ruminococcus sp.]|nr:hypothetical protein [Ruminococcus sp.]MDE5577122.1 hypothetical protein [Oscillospiraceae bacterium]